MITSIKNFVGRPPAGMDPIVYIFAMMMTIYLMHEFVSFLYSVFGKSLR